jgi:hypothetical protein
MARQDIASLPSGISMDAGDLHSEEACYASAAVEYIQHAHPNWRCLEIDAAACRNLGRLPFAQRFRLFA